MKFFLLSAVLGTLVAPGAGACSEDEVRDALNALNATLALETTSGTKPSPNNVITLCQSFLSKEGLFASCFPQRIKSVSTLAQSVRKSLRDFCGKECDGFSTWNDCVSRINTEYKNGTPKCNIYLQVFGECVNSSRTCELRQPLFVALLTRSFREGLYDEGCVPRPATVEVSDASNSLQTTSDLPASTVTSSLPVASATAAVTWQPAGLCNLLRARSCVGQIQERLDAYDYEKSLDALVPVCIASVKGDRQYECYHNNTAGCDPGNPELMIVKAMMDKADNDSKAICQTVCPSYEHAFWCAGLLANTSQTLSQVCRYYEAAMKCVTCDLSHAMLLELLGQNPPPDWQEVCELEPECPDLQLILLLLESCADKYNWTSANSSCPQVWGVSSCLRGHGIEGLRCSNISHLAETVIPGLTSAEVQCVTTTTTTPTTTTTTPTTTTPTTTTTTPTTTTPTTTTTTPTTTTPITTTTTPTTTTTAATTFTTTPSTTTSTTTTPTTTSTTTATSTTTDLMLLRSAVLETCPPDRLTGLHHEMPTPGSLRQPHTNNDSSPMNISSCIRLLEFEECLSKLAACVGSGRHSHCYSSLPDQLQTLVSKREWCLQSVYRAAADMEIIKTVTYTESGQHSEGYKGFPNVTCSKGTSALGNTDVCLCILLTLICAFLQVSLSWTI